MKSLRLAKETELEQIMALYNAVKNGDFCPWDETYPNWNTLLLDYASHGLYVYADGDTLYGVVTLLLGSELDDKPFWRCPSGHAREICRVAIHPSFQGHGLAVDMVLELEKMLTAAGVSAVHLLAIPDNIPACRTYSKAGYTVVGECDEYGNHYAAYEKLLTADSSSLSMLPIMSLQGLTVLQRLREGISSVLVDNLVGIYLHGSLVQGTFNWDVSDIDFLIVVHDEPTELVKRQLMDAILVIDETAPAKGLEMSVVLLNDCKTIVHPMPFCLHYSHSHTDRYRRDAAEYIRNMRGTDADLCSYAEMIRRCGIVLAGAPIDSVFGDIPASYVLDSFRQNVAESNAADANLPRYLAYQAKGMMLSKVIMVNEHPEVMFRASSWFSSTMGKPEEAIIRSMARGLGKRQGVPLWFVIVDRQTIVAGCCVTAETTAPLSLSDIFMAPDYRGIGLEQAMQRYISAVISMKA